MPRTYQYIRTLERVLTSYDGQEPFARFISRFFKENKQMGSRDRRNVSRLAYHYFRIGKAGLHENLLTRLVWAEFLCSEESPLVVAERPEWLELMSGSLDDKLTFIEASAAFSLSEVFPAPDALSPMIDQRLFLRQYFIQPDLFIRMKSGKESLVQRILDKHEISFTPISSHSLALPNGTGLDRIKELKGLFEIQDLSSQQSLDGISPLAGEVWWDACSGAGGKSLLLMDRHPDLHLFVSDIRPSILKNLDVRFEEAGIIDYRRKIMDLTRDTAPILGKEEFDGIILDAPCSGSGTWGRTPEALCHFDRAEITRFSELQKKISDQVIKHLKTDKPLMYITCSVFSEENEAVVQYLVEKHGLVVEDMKYLKGYEVKADTLFVARLTKF